MICLWVQSKFLKFKIEKDFFLDLIWKYKFWKSKFWKSKFDKIRNSIYLRNETRLEKSSSGVREADASRHNGGWLEAPSCPSISYRAVMLWGVSGGPPKTRQSLLLIVCSFSKNEPFYENKPYGSARKWAITAWLSWAPAAPLSRSGAPPPIGLPPWGAPPSPHSVLWGEITIENYLE